MGKNNLNINKQFMVGNGLLALGIFLIVAIFIYLSFRYQRKDGKIFYEGKYSIEISNDFAGDSIAVYINDSLLLNKVMPDETTKMTINRFAESSALMIVDNKTDNTTPFNLNDKGSIIKITKQNGIIYMLETER
ncbi:MAG: hypothetical protein ACTTKN_01100 [Phocaeicola sp.]|uniref:hypothetical protein n=1 Tax=Phocaeicola TaxID=909656 RepID=UPI00234F507E|nr:hypothetical protein [Phocaeicola oris]MCE2616896.1 hypothetical protein [Phocaeicola oris]